MGLLAWPMPIYMPMQHGCSRADRDRHCRRVPCFYSWISRQRVMGKSKEAPTTMHDRQTCGVVGPKEEPCLGSEQPSGTRDCVAARRPGQAQHLNRLGSSLVPKTSLTSQCPSKARGLAGLPASLPHPVTVTRPQPYQRLLLAALLRLLGPTPLTNAQQLGSVGRVLPSPEPWHWSGRRLGGGRSPS